MKGHNLAKFQLGKNGITEGVVESLTNSFKHHKQVRVSVLKSLCRDQKELKELAEDLASKIPHKLAVRTIGYTIILIKLK